jgi:hypothetical protein
MRLAGILVLAVLVAASATLFGAEFAPEAHHAGGAEAEHAEEGEEASHEEEQEEESGHEEEAAEEVGEDKEKEDTSVGQVLCAIAISIGGVALVPLTGLSAPRRRPTAPDAEAEITAEPRSGLAQILRAALAVLSAGAAVIHFAVIAQHLDEWWLSGVFFIAVALFQLAWAVAVLTRPSPLVYLTGAVVNALVVVTWIVSRTTGVPVGPEAGEREGIGLADVLATSFEAILVAVALALVLRAGLATRPLGPRAAAATTWMPAIAVVALTALALALLP